MNRKNEEKAFILNKLKEAAEAYYNNEQSVLTDEEYDKLSLYAEEKGWLIQDEKLNDGANIHNLNPNKTGVHQHTIPMLSLAKAKSLSELISFLSRINKETGEDNFFRIEPKLDGLAITLKYKDNKLVGAYTRGTGTQGEDASHIIDNKELEVLGLVKELKETGFNEYSEVRGELVCSKTDLIYNNTNRGEPFKNERIAVAGLLKKSLLGLGYKARLDFVPYSAYDVNGKEVFVPGNFDNRVSRRFRIPIFHLTDDIQSRLSRANSMRLTYEYPTDGVVIKMAQPIDLGSTGHHPLNAIAYKFPGESKLTRLLGVRWGSGKTGRLTPIGILEPVDLGGVTITHVSLNNMDWIQERGIKINSIVEVTRANDVIPYIKKVISNDESTQAISKPTHCPHCQSLLQENGSYIECQSQECPETLKSKLKQYASKSMLDIEGMSEALIEVLVDSYNIKDIVSLLDKLTLETLQPLKYANGTNLGHTRAKEIYKAIQYAKEHTDLATWFVTLDIPNIGKQTAKSLLQHFKQDIESILLANLSQLMEIEGIGLLTAQSIVNSRGTALEKWSKLKPLIKVETTQKEDIVYRGTFCITGSPPAPYKNRVEFVKAMEQKGWIFHSTIKKDTQYLVTDNLEANSSKLKKARELGIKIVHTLEDL